MCLFPMMHLLLHLIFTSSLLHLCAVRSFGWRGIQPPKKRLDYNPDYSTHAVAQVNLPSRPSFHPSFAVSLLILQFAVLLFTLSYLYFSLFLSLFLLPHHLFSRWQMKINLTHICKFLSKLFK